MSNPQAPRPAKLVIGCFMQNRQLIDPIAEALTDAFGPVDLISPWFDFDFTSYYAAEMGTPLYRRMFAFEKLIAQDALAGIKIETNQIEQRHLKGSDRRVNIDPGYLTQERFVLATGKNFTHRIYLERNIYADLTLMFTRGTFQALPWTYPDYREAQMTAFLGRVRQKYVADLKAIDSHSAGEPDRTKGV